MANGAERVQRLTREAFHRFRNDHEQFLDAYEKPTQIYRFLKARQALKPLFLHRNLSYMPRHSKSKRRFRKRLRVDELLEHTKDIKPDLAAEIKSDNHLKISFSGIEQGFSFQGLLAGSEETSAGKRAACEEDGVPRPGQLMEVELLLLKFKQSSVQLSEGSHPYSCSSLGKRFLKYKASSASHDDISDSNGGDADGEEDAVSSSQPNSPKESQDLTLTIPESVLTWKGDCGPPGTQMLVFRVSYVSRGPTNKPKRKPLQLINFVSRKGCRKNVKNVAVEVNRLNLAEIGQSKSKAKQQLRVGEPGSSRNDGEMFSEDAVRNGSGLGGLGGEGGGEMVEATSDLSITTSTMAAINDLSTSVEVMVGNGQRQGEGHVAAARDKQATPLQGGTEGGGGGGKGKSSLSKHSLLQKKSRTKLKKSKMDASVMTEISYGTDDIPDLYTTAGSHTPLTPPLNNYVAKGNHSNTYSFPPKDHTQSPPLPKVGFVHKCTSPRHPFRNGTLNGVLNGYALPEVTAALKGRSEPCPEKIHEDDDGLFVADQLKVGSTRDGFLKTLTKQSSKRRGRRKMMSQRHRNPQTAPPVGTGKRGTHSFLVSIPRIYYNNHRRPWSYSRNSADSAMQLAEEEARGGKSTMAPSTPHRRRSEIQLLFDGDKPPGQRISELDIPVFVAEDISNRSVSSTNTGSNAIWLGSSTRKITPTEHFSYPLHSPSPTKRQSNGIAAVANAADFCNGFSSATLSPGHGGSGGNHRKRMSSSMDTTSAISPPDSFPPSKQPKVALGISDFDPQPVTSNKQPAAKSLSSVSMNAKEKGEDCLPDPHPHPTAAEPVLEAEMALEGEEKALEGEMAALGGEKHGHLSNGLMMLTSFPPRIGAVTKGEGEKEEPSSSASQSSTSFGAELVVFDSRGECLVRDGEYSILMQCYSGKKSRGLSTFEPLTWKTVFGRMEEKEKNGLCQEQVEENPNLLLKFSVSWLQGPPQHRLCSQLTTALDLKKIREAYACPPSPATSIPSSQPSPSLLAPSNRPTSLFNFHHDLTTSQEPPMPHETFGSVKMSAGGGGGGGGVGEEEEVGISSQDATFSAGFHHHASLLPVNSSSSSLDGNGMTRPPSKVSFNFLYSNNTLQKTESRLDLSCPWCSLSCGRIYSLLKHMAMCHPRFHFTYTPNSEDGRCVINVHVNKLYNTGSASFDRDPGERSNVGLVQRRGGPSKCLSCSALLVERHVDAKEDLSEFLNDGSWKRGYNTNRIYYHSRSCLPMLPKELEAESEEQLQTLEWQNICSQKMIDEFTDVNQGEKELMKLWNIFALENKVIADKQIPVACLQFAQQKRELLHKRGLVPNYMSHMVNLFDFGMLPPAVLKKGMRVVMGLEEAGVS